MGKDYDAIVVGARCAGAPTAMLLARKGYKVLMVDRATFPSDTLSTHLIQPLGVATLARWGLLDRLAATGCPPIKTYAFDFGPFTITGSPGTPEAPVAYSPRRTILDKMLVDAAAEAGVEVREGFTVDGILKDSGGIVGIQGHAQPGAPVEERARVVIGADGRRSVVAESVRPDRYHEKPPVLVSYYAYWSGLPMEGRFETYVRPRRGFAAMPTHDDLTLVIAGWPHAELEANRSDIEGHYLRALGLSPELAGRMRGARRETKLAGTSVPNYFRKPYGPGWALVGDAGYIKDPITAQGIHDAFDDAERCVRALDETFTGARPFEEAMRQAQHVRDEQALAMYEFTYTLAKLEPPPPDLQQLLGAVHGNQRAMDRFAQMSAGTISPTDFFSATSVAEIMTAAPGAPPPSA